MKYLVEDTLIDSTPILYYYIMVYITNILLIIGLFAVLIAYMVRSDLGPVLILYPVLCVVWAAVHILIYFLLIGLKKLRVDYNE